MKYRVYNDTGDWFEVTALPLAECQRKAKAECERRGWSLLAVWSERVGI